MKHRIIFPDMTETTVNDKRFFSHAVVLFDNEKKQWFFYSLHKNYDLAAKKKYQCINTYSLRGMKCIDWFSATIVAIQ